MHRIHSSLLLLEASEASSFKFELVGRQLPSEQIG